MTVPEPYEALAEATGLLVAWTMEQDECLIDSDEPCDRENPNQDDGWCIACRTRWWLDAKPSVHGNSATGENDG